MVFCFPMTPYTCIRYSFNLIPPQKEAAEMIVHSCSLFLIFPTLPNLQFFYGVFSNFSVSCVAVLTEEDGALSYSFFRADVSAEEAGDVFACPEVEAYFMVDVACHFLFGDDSRLLDFAEAVVIEFLETDEPAADGAVPHEFGEAFLRRISLLPRPRREGP